MLLADTTKPTIKLVKMPWSSSVVNTMVAQILIQEVLGYPVESKFDREWGFTGDYGPEIFEYLANGRYGKYINITNTKKNK